MRMRMRPPLTNPAYFIYIKNLIRHIKISQTFFPQEEGPAQLKRAIGPNPSLSRPTGSSFFSPTRPT